MFLLPLLSFGQAEIGLYGGASYYMGDVNTSKLFYSPSPVYGIMYRYNKNKRYAFRISAVRTTLKGNDADFTKNGYQVFRNHSFQTELNEFSMQWEINFLPYLIGNMSEDFITAFVSSGANLMIAPMETPDFKEMISIPLTLGVKANMSDRLSVGAEWTYRKCFSDYLDQLNNSEINSYIKIYQKSYTTSKDWYSFAAVFLLFRLSKDSYRCHAYN